MIFIPNFDVFMYSNNVQVYTYVKRARKTCQHSYTGISLHVLTNFAPNAVEDHMHCIRGNVRTYVRMQLRDVNAWSRECQDCSPRSGEQSESRIIDHFQCTLQLAEVHTFIGISWFVPNVWGDNEMRTMGGAY